MDLSGPPGSGEEKEGERKVSPANCSDSHTGKHMQASIQYNKSQRKKKRSNKRLKLSPVQESEARSTARALRRRTKGAQNTRAPVSPPEDKPANGHLQGRRRGAGPAGTLTERTQI